MNIKEMQGALRKLEENRRERDKMAAMVDWCKRQAVSDGVKHRSTGMADIWINVPLDIAQQLYEAELAKREQSCIEAAKVIGVDHELYIPKDE